MSTIQNQIDLINEHQVAQDNRDSAMEQRLDVFDTKVIGVERKIDLNDKAVADTVSRQTEVEKRQTSVEQRFDEIMNGELTITNVEVEEARGGFDKLKDRLDVVDNRLVTEEGATQELSERVADWEDFKLNGGSITSQVRLDNLVTGNTDVSETGYTTLPNGMMLQWGVITDVPALTQGTATFKKPFPNACLMATGQILGGDASSELGTILQYTRFNVAVFHGYKSNRSIGWFAVGY